MAQRIVTLIGGAGFVGRYIVRRLAAAGYAIRVVSRHPNAGLFLKPMGDVGQIVLMKGDSTRPDSLAEGVAGAYAVVNLAGILFESGTQRFAAVHTHGTEKLAQIASAAGVSRFVHVSALGVDKASGSHYARSKMLGEKAVAQAFPTASILRPSIIFGAEDNFFNRFAQLAALSPALPLIGGGRTRFQPVYVDDVAGAAVACLERADAAGRIYELGGSGTYSFRDLLSYLLAVIEKRRLLLPVPAALAPLLASVTELLGKILPPPLLTRDQVKLLKYDNVVSPGAAGFADLGLRPTAMEIIVPEYLARFRKHKA